MTPFPRPAYAPLTLYAPDRRPIDLDLSDNTSRYGPHPAALRTLHGAEPEALTRYPAVYADPLRRAVSERFGVPPECVATGCGSDGLLDSVFRAAGEPGERISYPVPTFSMVEIFARMNGMEPAPKVLPTGGELSALLEPAPALVYLCRPNNPTGKVIPRAGVEALIEAVGDDGPLIVVDEAYADFADDDFLEGAAASSRMIVIRTFSKAYGLAGLRVGFAVGAAEVILEVEKSRGPYKVSRLGETAAARALRDEEGWIPKVVAGVRAERGRLGAALEARGWAPRDSGANFLLLPLPERRASEVVAALREQRVAVRPFPNLPGIGDAIRISLGRGRDTDRFLSAFDEVMG